MDYVAEGAHRGMTVQMEHTTYEDPLTDEAALMSEFHFFSSLFVLHGSVCFTQVTVEVHGPLVNSNF